MNKRQRTEQLRVLWEKILLSGKLEVCAEDLKGANLVDVNILRLLSNNPQIHPKAIAESLGTPKSTITNAISRLEKRGLTQRQLNTNDLRSLQLVLTDSGKQALLNHQQAERIKIGELFGILTDSEIESLIHILEKLVSSKQPL